MSELHLLRPAWLLLLPVALLLGSRMITIARQGQGWRKICSPHLLPYLLADNPHNKLTNPLILVTLFWFFAILALAGPSFNKKTQPVYRSTNTRVIVVDMSADLLASDLQPTRLARIKFKLADLIQRLPEGATALIAYADAPYLVAPPTNDKDTLIYLLAALKPEIMPSNGYSASSALVLAANLLKQNHAPRGSAIIWVTASPTTPAVTAAVKEIRAHGYRLNILGAATEEGAPVPSGDGFLQDKSGNLYLSKISEEPLVTMAEHTGGSYLRLQVTDSDLERLLPQLTTASVQPVVSSKRNADLFEDQGYWLLFAMIPFVVVWICRGKV